MNFFGVHICMDEINMLIFSIPQVHNILPWINGFVRGLFG